MEKVEKTLGVKLPEDYARFMEKYGEKLPRDPISRQSWVLGLGDAFFVEGTTEAFRSKMPNFLPENVVIGYSGTKTIVIDKISKEIDTYVMLNTHEGKILSVDSLGATQIIADGFEDWAGSEILAADLRDKYEGTLIAVLFDDELKAEEARAKLLKLQHQGYIDLEDIVVVVRQADGTYRHHQAHEIAKKGGALGSLVGLVAGALVLHPLLGAVLGAAAGAITASFEDVGIEDEFIRHVAENFKPGSSALFTLVIRLQPQTVLETFQGFGGKILVTSMSKEQAARLKASLDAVQESIYKNQEPNLDRIQ
ncbi:MAG: DUF1269 domain-containing protein [Syntrophobacteraceae bacterium]